MCTWDGRYRRLISASRTEQELRAKSVAGGACDQVEIEIDLLTGSSGECPQIKRVVGEERLCRGKRCKVLLDDRGTTILHHTEVQRSEAGAERLRPEESSFQMSRQGRGVDRPGDRALVLPRTRSRARIGSTFGCCTEHGAAAERRVQVAVAPKRGRHEATVRHFGRKGIGIVRLPVESEYGANLRPTGRIGRTANLGRSEGGNMRHNPAAARCGGRIGRAAAAGRARVRQRELTICSRR